MKVRSIVAKCASLGVTKLGITDHLDTLSTLPLHRRIRRDVEALVTGTDADSDIDVYFGVELNFLQADGGFAYSEQVRDELGFQFAIAGIHSTYLQKYDVEKLVAIQHRHHIRTCEDPLVQVLVHPYWFDKGEFDTRGFPWFDSMKAVPESMTRELGAAARETGTAVEINACANLLDGQFSESYVEYLAILESEGVRFAAGSDAHGIDSLQMIESAWAVMERLGLSEDRIWRPAGPPLAGGGRA